MAHLVLSNVSKQFDQTPVLKPISLEIEQGEFVVLVGPSGCGKSTLLRIIAGLEMPTTGEVWINQCNVSTVSPRDRDIAMVFQSYALYPHMTVAENMAFGLKMRKVEKSEIQRRVFQAARMLELEELLKRKPRELSGGQRQRVALGRALVREPQVFLMDEPLSNLDAKLRHHMRTEILRLHQHVGATTIYVTHDQTEAMSMGDRIVVLNQGEVQQVGKPQEVYDKPNTPFVGGFIGAMSFLPYRYEEQTLQFASAYHVDLLQSSLAEDLRQSFTSRPLGTMGVRPEHFEVLPSAHTIPIEMTVQSIERLGSEQMIYFDLSGSPMQAKLPAAETIPERLYLDLARVSFFNG
jgi:multiple sugar transport system ATP-binding protein